MIFLAFDWLHSGRLANENSQFLLICAFKILIFRNIKTWTWAHFHTYTYSCNLNYNLLLISSFKTELSKIIHTKSNCIINCLKPNFLYTIQIVQKIVYSAFLVSNAIFTFHRDTDSLKYLPSRCITDRSTETNPSSSHQPNIDL